MRTSVSPRRLTRMRTRGWILQASTHWTQIREQIENEWAAILAERRLEKEAADTFWHTYAPLLQKKMGLAPLTQKEAEAAYEAVKHIPPMPKEEAAERAAKIIAMCKKETS